MAAVAAADYQRGSGDTMKPEGDFVTCRLFALNSALSKRERAIAMLNDSQPTVSAAELERQRRDALCPSEKADAISFDWARIGFGIALAGGFYPMVLAAILTTFAAVMFAWDVLFEGGAGMDYDEFIGITLSIGLYTILAAMIGFLWSGVVAVLTLPVVYLIAWSLNLRASIVRVGAFAGGLVGFICVLPALLSVPWVRTSVGDVLEITATISLGPMLAIVAGQIGGAWGGHTSREFGPTRTWHEVAQPALWSASSAGHAEVSESPRRIQFGIRHLLWIAVWLSLLLTLIRICQIPYDLFLPLTLGWLAFQSAAMWVGGRLARWWMQRRERRRQSRST